MQDQFDVSLEDGDLLGEVELTTNLIIAASEADASKNASGVFERASSNVDPTQLGIWTVRVEGNGIPVFPDGQPVYLAVFAH